MGNLYSYSKFQQSLDFKVAQTKKTILSVIELLQNGGKPMQHKTFLKRRKFEKQIGIFHTTIHLLMQDRNENKSKFS